MLLNQIFETTIVEGLTRTGRSNTAVLGWGRGMGHQGHMYLASSVITQANESKADPYFVVSRTVGKDDPLTPTEKLSIYKRVFAEHKQIFQSTSDAAPDLNRILGKLQEHGYTKVLVVLGEDQVQSFQYLKNYNGKKTKSGEVLYTFESIDVISRQQTNDPSKTLAGPRATDMRAVLLDPSKLDEDKFAVWRDAMSPKLADEEVHMIMKLAEHRLKNIVEKKDSEIDAGNHEQYLNDKDIERQLTLESYGYKFIRINRFNLGKDPIKSLSDRLYRLVDAHFKDTTNAVVRNLQNQASSLINKTAKSCPICKQIKNHDEYYDPKLKEG